MKLPTSILLLCTLIALHCEALTIPKVEKWVRLGDYPKSVFEAQGSFLKSKKLPMTHLVCGGFENFPGVTKACYKRKLYPKDAKWVRAADMPKAITHMAQAFHGHKMYMAGGYLGPHPGRSIRDVYVFNVHKNKWSQLASLPADRAGGGMIYYRNKKKGIKWLIFGGGGDRDTVGSPGNTTIVKHIDYSTTWRLDLTKKDAKWVNLNSPMPDPRNHQGSVQVCGRYFWVGGQYKENEVSGNRPTCNEYFPKTNKWGSIADLSKPLGHVSASTLPYKCGFITIGGVTNQRERLNDIYYWEPTENKWHLIGYYPIKLATPVCGIRDRRIMCATGSSAGKNMVFTTYLKLQKV